MSTRTNAPYLISVEGTRFPEGAIGIDTKDVTVVGQSAFIRIAKGGYEQSGWVPLTHREVTHEQARHAVPDPTLPGLRQDGEVPHPRRRSAS
jgi:hypothetical protein